MKKTTADSKAKGKKTGYTRDLLLNSCQGKAGGVFVRVNSLNGSICC